jgi:hypothetical protein
VDEDEKADEAAGGDEEEDEEEEEGNGANPAMKKAKLSHNKENVEAAGEEGEDAPVEDEEATSESDNEIDY